MPGSEPNLRAKILELLAVAGEAGGPLRILLEGDGVRAEITLDAVASRPVVADGLSPLERVILSAATREPLTAKRLAATAGRSCNGYFRDHLRKLVRRGLLIHTADGYRTP